MGRKKEKGFYIDEKTEKEKQRTILSDSKTKSQRGSICKVSFMFVGGFKTSVLTDYHMSVYSIVIRNFKNKFFFKLDVLNDTFLFSIKV